MNAKTRLQKLEKAKHPSADTILAVKRGEALTINGIPPNQAHLDELRTQGHRVIVFRVERSQ